VSWKLSRTVLRGGATGNGGSPLDTTPAEGHHPYWFHRPDNALIVLAGLWQWQEVEEPAGFFQVFAIITTRANGVMASIHDRMPVVIDPGQLDTRMNVAATDLVLAGPCSHPRRMIGWSRIVSHRWSITSGMMVLNYLRRRSIHSDGRIT
jgi:hypothetical protein